MKSRQELVLGCQGLVNSIAWQVQKQISAPVEFDDLVADGNMGLSEAAERYRPETGVAFTTFAYRRVRGAIMDGLQHNPAMDNSAAPSTEILEKSLEDKSLVDNDMAWLKATALELTMSGFLESCHDLEGYGNLPSSAPLANLMAQETRRVLVDAIRSLSDDSKALIISVYFEGKKLKEVARQLGISQPWAGRLHRRTLRVLAIKIRGKGE
ncbi:MAG: sigma-70 family RNA polymerase sigma factor [Planctomycetota bacterium]